MTIAESDMVTEGFAVQRIPLDGDPLTRGLQSGDVALVAKVDLSGLVRRDLVCFKDQEGAHALRFIRHVWRDNRAFIALAAPVCPRQELLVSWDEVCGLVWGLERDSQPLALEVAEDDAASLRDKAVDWVHRLLYPD